MHGHLLSTTKADAPQVAARSLRQQYLRLGYGADVQGGEPSTIAKSLSDVDSGSGRSNSVGSHRVSGRYADDDIAVGRGDRGDVVESDIDL